MQVKFFDPAKIYLAHKDEFDEAIQRVLTSGKLILGDEVEKFEANLANYVGTKYAVGLNSGTDALYLALKSLKIGPGDEVLVPSHTFVSTAQVVAQIGAIPRLFDLNEVPNWGQEKALIIAHIAGEASEWYFGHVPIIEDACQAMGALKNPTTKIQCWSFYPAKTLGAFGDAGALTTNDEEIYNEVKELRNHYKKDFSKWGINSRLDSIQAAILNVRFRYLADSLQRRAKVAWLYIQALKDVEQITLPPNTFGRVWQDFIIEVDERDKLFEYLKERGIEIIKNEYPMPIGKLPKAKLFESRTIRLPCNDHLEDREVLSVAESIGEFYEKN